MEKLVIFDLDGTLLNTIADLANCVNHTLSERNLPLHTLDEYRLMVGNGMRKLVERALPATKAADAQYVENTLAAFLDYYASNIDLYTRPYPGIPELIETLSAQGYKLAVASNKIQAGTETLISKFFPHIGFTSVMGNSPLYPLKPDAALVEYIMDKAGSDRAHTVMVGDSGTDIQTARNAGIPVIAVTWGFRPRNELEAADFMADTTAQVLQAVKEKIH
jgi:phosphoglycolate phosphatase